MAKLSEISTDPKLEKDGVWLDYAVGIRVKVSRLDNPEYREHLATALKPYRTNVKQGKVDPEAIAKDVKRVRAEYILRDWMNIEDEDGKPIPYSPEKAFEVFMDPKFHDFYEFVIGCSEQAANFRLEVIQEELGNSKASSSGNELGEGTNPS